MNSIFFKWKTTLIFNYGAQFNVEKKEDDLHIWETGRQPQYFEKWKTTSLFNCMEGNINIRENGQDTSTFL